MTTAVTNKMWVLQYSNFQVCNRSNFLFDLYFPSDVHVTKFALCWAPKKLSYLKYSGGLLEQIIPWRKKEKLTCFFYCVADENIMYWSTQAFYRVFSCLTEFWNVRCLIKESVFGQKFLGHCEIGQFSLSIESKAWIALLKVGDF